MGIDILAPTLSHAIIKLLIFWQIWYYFIIQRVEASVEKYWLLEL